MRYVYSFRECPNEVLGRAGGKGASLVRMVRMGLPVPDGFVITSDGFIDGEPRAEVLEYLAANLPQGCTYAVRSSALNEDGGENSFAGQYETVTDVAPDGIEDALRTVGMSAYSSRVEVYSESARTVFEGIGAVVQKFVKPEIAGVLFTADPITGSAATMVGNFVRGEGELLVSGTADASEFRIDAMKYAYEGEHDLTPHAKSLFRYAGRIRDSYGCQVDIEWAVSGGRLYVLQARPITTMNPIDRRTYRINGSLSGEHLLTKTNVGEIFMKPLTPATYSALEKINEFLGLPEWLTAIDGQAYMNVSVVCSMLVAMGMSRPKAYDAIKDIVGSVPEGTEVPIAPFDAKSFRRNLKKLVFGDKTGMRKMSKREKIEMVRDLQQISKDMIEEIRAIDTNAGLASYWDKVMIPRLKEGLSAVMATCGTQMVPLFGTRSKLDKLVGPGMSGRLCGGGLGMLASMKPVLLLEDLRDGKIDEDKYMNECGQRCINEMELAEPRPYETGGYIENALANYEDLGVNAHAMLAASEEEYKKAMAELQETDPAKARKAAKMVDKFAGAHRFREEIRSKGVWIFSILREFLLRAGGINGLGDDIFMLYLDETLALVKGTGDIPEGLSERKENYAKYISSPAYPAVIIGRFDPSSWMADPDRRLDFYSQSASSDKLGSDVSGFPGAAGKVRGTVRVITDIADIDSIEPGEILVACATNIGWTRVFPKVSAIVTDIGAPLSHAAIVAREFGIPAVVGCGNATTVLKTGDTVEVNGSSGEVTVIEHA